MEVVKKRLSMNTSLKNARIFDEVLNDEPPSPPPPPRWDIKKEDSEEESDIRDKLTTLKKELFDEDTNFSMNTEAFDKIHIKKEDLDELASPMKNEDSNSRKSFKSAKLSLYKKRDSPYKPVLDRLGPSVSGTKTLSFDENNTKPKKRISKNELETDPAILSRRQKQIDYGKNTVGYDEYCSRVPRNERKPDDPQTPNKYQKYSRRGWDGLIKQWRLRLHKYDPDN